MNSIDTRFSKNVFAAVQKTRSTCFIGSKTDKTLLLVFKHYISCCRVLHVLQDHLENGFYCTIYRC